MRFGNTLSLTDENDVLKVTSSLTFNSYQVKISLLADHILVDEGRKSKRLSILQGSVLLFSVNGGGQKAPNSFAEMYLKTGDELNLACIFSHYEPVANIHQMQSYALAEYIAERIAKHYNIQWKFKYSIDSVENRKRINTVLLFIMLIWILMFTMIIISNSS